MGMHPLHLLPVIVLVLPDDCEAAVCAATGQFQPVLKGREGHSVDRVRMEGENAVLLPIVDLELFPDDDLFVKPRTGQQRAELGVGPADLPGRALVGVDDLLANDLAVFVQVADDDAAVSVGIGQTVAEVVVGGVVDHALGQKKLLRVRPRRSECVGSL